ncbi:MAG: hypothetical protein HZC38_04910 [Chloroflexi bacterium]|nr:hypothetical protein [Chloroflexota bacterium]
MRTCAKCNKRSSDETPICPKCGADLNRDSVTAHALANYQALPIEGCSCANGCEAHYEPMLNLIYP